MLRILIALLFVLAPALVQADDDYVSSNIIASYPMNKSGKSYPSGQTLQVTFDQAVGATYTSEIGGYVFSKVGTGLVKTVDITYPNGLSGALGNSYRFNGTDDRLNLADAGDVWAPNQFSVFAVVTLTGLDGMIFGKYSANISWVLYAINGDMYFITSSNGTDWLAATAVGCSNLYRQHSIVATYNCPNPATCDGASTAVVYCDEMAAATSNVMKGPPYKGGIALSIGGRSSESAFIAGEVHHTEFIPRVLTATEARHKIRHWQGRAGDNGRTISVTNTHLDYMNLQMVPSNSGIEPFYKLMPASTNMVSSTGTGIGGLYNWDTISNYVQRPSFETCSLNGSTEPDGWGKNEYAGNGSVNMYCTTATKAAGQKSVRMDIISGTTSKVWIYSNCMAFTRSQPMYASAWAKRISGTVNAAFRVWSYTESTCTTGAGGSTFLISAGNIGTDWVNIGNRSFGEGYIAANYFPVSATYVRMELRNDLGNVGAMVWDAAQLRKSANIFAHSNAFCDQNAAGTNSCSGGIISTVSPVHGNSSTRVSATFNMPYSGVTPGAGTYYIMSDGDNGAANSVNVLLSLTTDEPYMNFTDAAAGIKTVTPNSRNITHDLDYVLQVNWDGNGGISMNNDAPGMADAGFYAVTTGAGTGKRTANGGTFYLNGSSVRGSDMYVKDVVFTRGK